MIVHFPIVSLNEREIHPFSANINKYRIDFSYAIISRTSIEIELNIWHDGRLAGFASCKAKERLMGCGKKVYYLYSLKFAMLKNRRVQNRTAVAIRRALQKIVNRTEIRSAIAQYTK